MATRWQSIPGLTEDVVDRTAEDIGKVRKRMNVDSTNLKGGARESVREAGARGARRLGARAGAVGAALQGGYDLGREIDERTGVGKKLVDKTVGPAIDRAVNKRDKVELSEDAKERIRRGDLKEKPPEELNKLDPDIVRMYQRNSFHRATEDDMEFAKGGGVRGWGKARGARKAKNY